MQEEILKLVKAAVEGNKEAQEQIEQILQVAQQPNADPKIVKVAQFIMQVLQPESAKKGTKAKKKPLINTKKCGDKIKKGGFGLHSKKCSCMLHRVGGSIIEIDSCTGLPYRKSGGILKGQKGIEAWYNTAAATGTGTKGQKHYYKEGNVWKVQEYGDTGWGQAENYGGVIDDSNYAAAYAKGYNPNTGVFEDEASYNAALANKENVNQGQNVVKRIGNAEVEINPYLKTDNTGLQSSDKSKVVNARMIGSQKAYINNIKNQIRRTIRYSGLSFKDRLKARKEWGVNVGNKDENSWFMKFKNNMANASKQTLNYMQTLQNTPAETKVKAQSSNTTPSTQISVPTYNDQKFKQGGKLKIKLK